MHKITLQLYPNWFEFFSLCKMLLRLKLELNSIVLVTLCIWYRLALSKWIKLRYSFTPTGLNLLLCKMLLGLKLEFNSIVLVTLCIWYRLALSKWIKLRCFIHVVRLRGYKFIPADLNSWLSKMLPMSYGALSESCIWSAEKRVAEARLRLERSSGCKTSAAKKQRITSTAGDTIQIMRSYHIC